MENRYDSLQCNSYWFYRRWSDREGYYQDNLNLTVKLSNPAATTATIANIAQVIGSTKDPTTGTPGTDTVYDESGDQNPNNYNGATAPTTNTITNG